MDVHLLPNLRFRWTFRARPRASAEYGERSDGYDLLCMLFHLWVCHDLGANVSGAHHLSPFFDVIYRLT
jgi:hypothetical protein